MDVNGLVARQRHCVNASNFRLLLVNGFQLIFLGTRKAVVWQYTRYTQFVISRWLVVELLLNKSVDSGGVVKQAHREKIRLLAGRTGILGPEKTGQRRLSNLKQNKQHATQMASSRLSSCNCSGLWFVCATTSSL
jgi:hypothetical protein